MKRRRRDEARAWRDLPPDPYDVAVCDLLDDLAAGPLADLIALSSATLRRSAASVTESRGRAARYLLDLTAETREHELRSRAHVLVLLAWLRLGATIAAGPDSITVTPDLPHGAIVPFGADPMSIADPSLRAEALQLAERHAQDVALWNAKQRAIGHVSHLAELVTEARRDDAMRELAAAMSLVPGIPEDVRAALVWERDPRES
jgi:hypothetical protein